MSSLCDHALKEVLVYGKERSQCTDGGDEELRETLGKNRKKVPPLSRLVMGGLYS